MKAEMKNFLFRGSGKLGGEETKERGHHQ